MNTSKLKSSKLMRMLKDCGILKTPKHNHFQMNEQQMKRYGKVKKVSSIEVDLMFTMLTSNPNVTTYHDTNQSLMGQSTLLDRSNFLAFDKSVISHSPTYDGAFNKSMMGGTSMWEGQSQYIDPAIVSKSKGKMEFDHF